MMLELIATKLASLGVAAKVGVATATVAAGTVGAGATGSLPDPIQDRVADGVAAVTPFELPSSAADEAEFGGRVAEDAADPDDPGVDGSEIADEASDGRSSEQAEEHRPEDPGIDGDRVAEDAADPEDPGVDGSEIADEASDGSSSPGDDAQADHRPEQSEDDEDTDERSGDEPVEADRR